VSRPEDDEIAIDRRRRHAELLAGATRLEYRAHQLILEAADLRKLAARLEEIATLETADVHRRMP
jgi:hypothetical protein